MQDYDATLKILLQNSTGSVLQEASGLKVVEWLDMELPEVQVRRADLIAGTEEGPILHVELQSTNDPNMALRMLEYALRIYRKWQQFPRQIVLYVGDGKLTMTDQLRAHSLLFSYRLIDFRDIDGLPLLKSERIEDNLLAILAKLPDVRDAIRQILVRITKMDEPARKDALVRFLILSNLRHLSLSVKEEVRNMPITESILDHELFGPLIRQGRQEGLKEGRQQAALELVCQILEKRFGPLPSWVQERLAGSSGESLNQIVLRALDASSFQDLFPA